MNFFHSFSSPYAIIVTNQGKDVVALKATIELVQVKEYINKYYQEPLLEAMIEKREMSYSEFVVLPSTEPFNDYLFQLIDEKGLDDVSVYKKAHLDRRLFSKIRSDDLYQPSKKTVFKLTLALELTYKEAKEFLEHAGFAFSRSSKFDLVIEYAIKHQCYNIFEVNELLDEITGDTLQ